MVSICEPLHEELGLLARARLVGEAFEPCADPLATRGRPAAAAAAGAAAAAAAAAPAAAAATRSAATRRGAWSLASQLGTHESGEAEKGSPVCSLAAAAVVCSRFLRMPMLQELTMKSPQREDDSFSKTDDADISGLSRASTAERAKRAELVTKEGHGQTQRSERSERSL
jgi:hypothetical protein